MVRTNDLPAVTVIIPTHNREGLLLRTLDAVLGQVGVEVDVVVVDDGGVDGSADAVRSLGQSNVRVIRHDISKGVSAARNAGLAVAEAPWVAFVDDDDLWAPNKLFEQVRALESGGVAEWSCVGAVHIDSRATVQSYVEPPQSGTVAPLMLRGQAIPGGGSGVVASTKLARDIGGFDENISIVADWEFYLRLSLRSPLAAVNRPLLGYYVHSDSMYHDPMGLADELRYMEKKYSGSRGHDRLRLDYASWYISLVRIAQLLGDRRTARRMLIDGFIQARPVPFLREITIRIVRKFRNRVRARVRASPPSGWEGELRWLARYVNYRVESPEAARFPLTAES